MVLGIDDGVALDVDLLQIRDAFLKRGLHLEGLGVRGHRSSGLLLML